MTDRIATNDKVEFIKSMLKRERVSYLTKDGEDLKQVITDIKKQYLYVKELLITVDPDNWFNLTPVYEETVDTFLEDPEVRKAMHELFNGIIRYTKYNYGAKIDT